MSEPSTQTIVSGIYTQIIYNPHRDDLAEILKGRPFEVLLSAVRVTESKIVLRFGPPPMPAQPINWNPFVHAGSGHAP